MTKVEVDIVINQSPEDVFAYITNFANNTLWQNGVKSAEVTSTGKFGVGSTYSQISQFLGRRIEFHFEITEYAANRRIRFKTVSGSFPVDIVRAVEPVIDGTKVSAIVQGDATGFFRVFSPLMDWMTKRSIQADYTRLKQILEASN